MAEQWSAEQKRSKVQTRSILTSKLTTHRKERSCDETTAIGLETVMSVVKAEPVSSSTSKAIIISDLFSLELAVPAR